jgi:hypothetical protein
MISSADFTVSLLGAVSASAPRSAPQEVPQPREAARRTTSCRTDLMTASGQLSGPPPGSYTAVPGLLLVAAVTRPTPGPEPTPGQEPAPTPGRLRESCHPRLRNHRITAAELPDPAPHPARCAIRARLVMLLAQTVGAPEPREALYRCQPRLGSPMAGVEEPIDASLLTAHIEPAGRAPPNSTARRAECRQRDKLTRERSATSL